MTIRAPSEGSVTEKMIVEGQKIEPGETLYKIIDHSVVWVYGEIYEYEIPYIKSRAEGRPLPCLRLFEALHRNGRAHIQPFRLDKVFFRGGERGAHR